MLLAGGALASAVASAVDWPQRLGPKRDGGTTEKVAPWKENESICTSSSRPTYLVTNITETFPVASLTCVEARSGKQLWTKKGVGYFHASVVRTGDGKLLTLSDAGQLSLLEVDEKGARELARAKVCGGTLVSPALSDGRLYVRDSQEVICRGLP